MKDKVRSGEKNVKELFTDKHDLDYYQREYVWKPTEEVQELMQDLYDDFSRNYKEGHERRDVGNYGHYFLGPIITCKKDEKLYIIDGQQRLTTLTLILIYLNSLKSLPKEEDLTSLIKSSRHGEMSFNLNIPERDKIMTEFHKGNTYVSSGDEPRSIYNIWKAYNKIKKFFKKHFPKEYRCLHFLDWFLTKVILVEIQANGDDQAYIIFETMNDRGTDLTPAEMLRGYLLSNITDPERRNSARSVWDGNIQTLARKARASSKSKDKDKVEKAIQASIQACIKAWLRGQYAHDINDFDAIGGHKFHRWFREKSHKNRKLTSSDDFADFIERDFKFYTDQYLRILSLADQDDNDLEDGLECVKYNAKNNPLQYSLMLAPLCIEDTDDTILQKIRIAANYFDIFIHRRIWNGHNIDSQIHRMIFQVIKSIRGKSSSDLADTLHQKLKNESLDFDHSFSLEYGNKDKIRRILARMTDYVDVQSKRPSRYTYTDYMSSGKKGYDVQQIWADDPEPKLFHPHPEPNTARNRIGGLLLIPNDLNNIDHLPYDDKRQYYLDQNLLAASLHEQTYERNPGFQAVHRKKRSAVQGTYGIQESGSRCSATTLSATRRADMGSGTFEKLRAKQVERILIMRLSVTFTGKKSGKSDTRIVNLQQIEIVIGDDSFRVKPSDRKNDPVDPIGKILKDNNLTLDDVDVSITLTYEGTYAGKNRATSREIIYPSIDV